MSGYKYKNTKEVEKILRKKFEKHNSVYILFNEGAIEITNFFVSEYRVYLMHSGIQIGYIDYRSITGIYPFD